MLNYDEPDAYALALFDKSMAKGGGKPTPPALSARDSWSSTLNPPAASTVARGARGAPPGAPPIALAPSLKPLPVPGTHIGGRGGIPMPVVGGGGPGPRFSHGPVNSGGGGRGRTTLQTAPKPLALVSDAQAKTTARTTPITALNSATAIPGGAAATLPSQAPLVAPVGSNIVRQGNSFSAPDGAGTVTLADARNAGNSGYGLSVVGKGLGPEATLADLKGQVSEAQLKTRLHQAGLKDDAEGRAAYERISQQHNRANDIAELTQSGFSPRQAAGSVFQRDAALAQQTAESPSQSALNQQALASGAQTLQKGEMELQQGDQQAQVLQAKRAIAEKLGALDPADTKTRSALIDELLAYDSKVQTPAKSLGYGVYTDSTTGATVPYSKDTGVTGQQGGAQATQPDGVYEMPGIGKMTVRGGIAYDEKGNILQ